MSVKPIHMVFQVLNFIHSDISESYKLIPVDKLILITLASHKGIKGIFPMQETLAKEVGVKRRHLRYRLKHLEKIGLIFVEKIGKNHHYHFAKLSTIEALECTYDEKTGALQCTNRGTTVPLIGALQLPVYNKVRTKKNRESAKRAPLLSVDESFEPDQERKAKCINLGHDLNFMIQKFVAFSRANGKKYEDVQSAFELFALNERGSAKEKPRLTVVKPTEEKYIEQEKEETCSGCKRPVIYCRCKHKREEGSAKIQEIMKKLKL